MADRFLDEQLRLREEEDSLRSLRDFSHLIDFSSNDYLGFARSNDLRELIEQSVSRVGSQFVGSTGSRLISGNSSLCEEIESEIAAYHGAESGLIFNSGYDANLGLLASIPRRGDTVIFDELAHASIRDGVRLGFARAHSFRHSDLGHLEERLSKAKGIPFVVVESVYSMDGDLTPLAGLVSLCSKYDARLMVDEAHATGVIGPIGEGLVASQRLNDQIFARIHTFGKALGVHGAIVLGSKTVRQYLLNFSRSFIYTTALPPHSLVSIRCAYRHLSVSGHLIDQLTEKVGLFRQRVAGGLNASLLPSDSAIQGIVVPGNRRVRALAKSLQEDGFDVRPILSPTVPVGKERIRICIHAFNSDDDICRLADRVQFHMESGQQE